MAEDPHYIKEVKRFIQDIPKATKNCQECVVQKSSLKLFIKEAKYGNEWPTCQRSLMLIRMWQLCLSDGWLQCLSGCPFVQSSSFLSLLQTDVMLVCLRDHGCADLGEGSFSDASLSELNIPEPQPELILIHPGTLQE